MRMAWVIVVKSRSFFRALPNTHPKTSFAQCLWTEVAILIPLKDLQVMKTAESELANLTSAQELDWFKKELADKNLIIDTILESTLAGYWDWRIQDNTEYLSPTFKKMFGYEDHEMENKPESWQEILHPDDLASVFDLFDKHVASKGEIPFNNTVRYFHKNGGIVNVFCQGHVVEWDGDTPIRMIGAHIDVTQLKQSEEHLTNRNAELEEFSYATSHDLKEPLRTISSFIELLKNEELGEAEKIQYMDIVDASAKRMTALIQGLLDHSRIGKEKVVSQVGVSEILDNVCADLQQCIKEKQAIVSYPKDLPRINAYPIELRTLFQNLISNAIKFMAAGTVPLVKISYTEDDIFHTFHIKDNGIGIAQEKQEQIFKLFKQLNPMEDFPGTGIGLTHCKKIAQLHEGVLSVQSKINEGSIFSISINKNLSKV